MEKLAIVIPYFKLTYFEDTLESLSSQTDKRFKVYIGNDTSPEDPTQLLDKYKGQFDFLYHKFDKNLGGTSLAKQWERCIKLSNDEEWIMVLGDDDVLGSTVIETFYKNYDDFNFKSNVIRFATKKIFGKKVHEDNSFFHPVWESATDSFYRKFNLTTRSTLSEYIFTRETYIRHGFYDYPLAWNSDDKAWLDFSDGKPIFSINQSFVYFRMSDFNISGKQDNYVLKNKSEIEFYKFIVNQKLNYYNNDQKLRLIRRYQAELRRFSSLKIKDYFILLYYYLRHINSKWMVKIFRKITREFFKKNNKNE